MGAARSKGDGDSERALRCETELTSSRASLFVVEQTLLPRAGDKSLRG
jgi:hypothetical protein